MEPFHTAIELISQLEPEAQHVAAFIAGSIATGGCKEIGALAARNFSTIFSRHCSIFKRRNGRDFADEDLAAIPIDIRAEIFRVASFASDEEMQEIWAALLCSFAEDPSRYAKIKFISMLHEMDSLDALVFRRVYEICIPDGSAVYETNVFTKDLPVAAHSGHDTENKATAERMDPSPAVQVSLENLERLSLIRSALMWKGPAYSVVFRTRLGTELAKALLVEEQT